MFVGGLIWHTHQLLNIGSIILVLLISPAPVDEERQYARTNAVLKQYAEVVSDVAARTGSNFFDLYTSIIQLPNYKLLLENEKQDGLHFGVHGYEYLAEVIIEKIKEIKC